MRCFFGFGFFCCYFFRGLLGRGLFSSLLGCYLLFGFGLFFHCLFGFCLGHSFFLSDFSGLFEQPADGHVAPPFFRLPLDDSGSADRCRRSTCVACSDRSSACSSDQLSVELAELS